MKQLRSLTVASSIALLIGLAVANGLAQVPIGATRILPKPSPAPTLPPAGESFNDPTFGTRVVRVTDPVTAPHGATVNSAAQDTMFNSDTSLFYVIYRAEGGTWIYTLDGNGAITRLGQLPAWVTADGAAWDPQNPNRLFVVLISQRNRDVLQLDITRAPWRVTETRLFSFAEVPAGGYPYSRIQVSPDGRAFALIVSTTGGQDTYDHVVIWDRQTGSKRIVKTTERTGVSSMLHSSVMDTSGEYLILEGVPWGKSWVYHWPTDTFSRVLTGAEGFEGHKAPGFKEVVHPGLIAGQWMRRSLANVEDVTEILRFPQRTGRRNWYEDSHSTKIGVRGFVQSRYVSGAFPAFRRRSVLYAGAVFKVPGFLAQSADLLPPEFLEYDGQRLPRVEGIPTAAGQWSYETGTDSLYCWLPDSANPGTTPKLLKAADWRPLMEEIIRFYPDGSGRWTWQRLAHHRSQNRSFGEIPRGNLSPDGKWVLFQSNWDGSPRGDVFLLSVVSGAERSSGTRAHHRPTP